MAAEAVRITFLGGLGEIGRNCAAIEIEGRIMLLDCGLMFPDTDMLGIDVVLPDFTWLRERADDIEGCILTHGHEDHVGALSYALQEFKFPIISSEFTLGLARGRIEENGVLKNTKLIVVKDNERRKFGPFDCEFLPITHSVPHGFATAFHTPQGTILHSGDFKIDLTPVDGRLSDLSRIGGISSGDGIRLLLSDSTNAEEHGHSRSEKAVGGVLYDLMHQHIGRRIITACFASHIHRVQQLADAAQSFGRVIIPLGRSMRKNIAMARQMGILDIPDSALADIEDIGDYDDGQICVVSTGSQGEPMSALTLLGGGENRWLKVTGNDTVILSSHPIPGNEMNVSKVIDNLVRLGVRVVHSGIHDVHATGHAKQEELKTLLSVVRPEWFVPVHGEYRHLVAHADLARIMHVDPAKVMVAEDGDQLVLDDQGLRMTAGSLPSTSTCTGWAISTAAPCVTARSRERGRRRCDRVLCHGHARRRSRDRHPRLWRPRSRATCSTASRPGEGRRGPLPPRATRRFEGREGCASGRRLFVGEDAAPADDRSVVVEA